MAAYIKYTPFAIQALHSISASGSAYALYEDLAKEIGGALDSADEAQERADIADAGSVNLAKAVAQANLNYKRAEVLILLLNSMKSD